MPEFHEAVEVALPHEEAKVRAYMALRNAAEQIGRTNLRSGIYKPKTRRGKMVQGYSITAEHRAVIDAMSDVLSGKISPEEAMALLLSHEVMRQRFAS